MGTLNLENIKCPVFGKCGGCLYQDKDYLSQIEYKKNKAIELFNTKKLKGLSDIKIFFKKPYFYRNRMDFVFSENGLGLRRKGTFNKIINFEKCYIANENINNIFSKINEWFFENKEKIDVFNVNKTIGTLRYAVIRSGEFSQESSVTFILNKDSDKIEDHKKIIKKLIKEEKINNLLIGYVKHNTDRSVTDDYEVIKGKDIIYEKLADKIFYYHTQSFFQNNPFVVMDVLFYLREKINKEYNFLVDLFGGAGVFGVFLSEKAKEVLIIDNDKNNLKCAEMNINENNAKNVRVYNIDAKEIKKIEFNLKKENSIFLVDPPRSGIHKKTKKTLLSILPEKIIYVSCNLHSFIQDLKDLSTGYDLKDIAIFDMFPQTPHFEVVAELDRK